MYYNKNLDFINFTIKKLLLENINNMFQEDLKICVLNDYNLILKTILLQKNEEYTRILKKEDKILQEDTYNEFVYKEIICKMYDIKNKVYYTNNFNMNLNKKDKKINEERKNYLMNLISLVKKNINVIISDYKITLNSVINKIVMDFITFNFKKIIEHVNLNKLKKIIIKIDKNFVFSVDDNKMLTFNILDYFINLKIDYNLLKKQIIKKEIIHSFDLILTHNYKFNKFEGKDLINKDLILYGEIIF